MKGSSEREAALSGEGTGRGPVEHLGPALELFLAVEDTTCESCLLVNGALASGEAGDLDKALALLDEAMAKSTREGNRKTHALARLNLGCFLLERGEAARACEHLEAVARTGRQLGMRLLEGVALGEQGRALLVRGRPELAQFVLMEAIGMLERVSRWHTLRFSAHLAAAQAALGNVLAAREGLAALESSAELRADPSLRGLTSMLRASVEAAVARTGVPGSREAEVALEAARRRLARARSALPAEASSDLRVSLRLLEQTVMARG
ncbi:hypothetical protein [Pyxidicoccus xibeiensis]|uniref:hypothetical protein n=1 Tax=Pyxidicoccus xibeiensis TaxID=2906759 RepID=UPI0020A78401|nr:hypothetical protein [Pyxidicoccus xibeiensis]MCP3143551.1 hypothetical protein [Pyxidicoccus xibeiensis]